MFLGPTDVDVFQAMEGTENAAVMVSEVSAKVKCLPLVVYFVVLAWIVFPLLLPKVAGVSGFSNQANNYCLHVSRFPWETRKVVVVLEKKNLVYGLQQPMISTRTVLAKSICC